MNILKHLIAFAFMLGISSMAGAAVQPPPVNQNLGIPDTVFALQDANVCKNCHHNAEDVFAPVNPGYNPDRHHSGVMSGTRLADGLPDFPPQRDVDGDGVPDQYLTCLSCHIVLSDPATGQTYYEVDSLDQTVVNNFRNCLNCHEWASGETSVHHRTDRAQQGNCFQCHGGLVRGIDVDTLKGKKPDPLNPGEVKPVDYPTYQPSMITPWTSAKPNADDSIVSTAGQSPGSCAFCHNTLTGSSLNPDGSGGTPEPFTLADGTTTVMIDIFTNKDNHHGTGFFSEGKCAWCHTLDATTGAVQFKADSIRTCQNCHDRATLHNIEFDAIGDGTQPGQEQAYFGHIGNVNNCWGCHGNNNTVIADDGTPLDPITLEPILNQSINSLGSANVSGAIIPTLTSLSEQSIGNGTDTIITAKGTSFSNTGKIKRSTDSPVEEYTWTSEIMLTDKAGNVTLIEPNTQDLNTLEFTLPASTPLGFYEVQIKKAYQYSNPLGILVREGVSPIQSFIYTPYGPLVVITGKGFTDALAESTRTSAISLTDQNGTAASRIYVWRDDFIVAHFDDYPETVKVKTLFEEKVIPLSRFPAQ